jgi:hypothetical protein
LTGATDNVTAAGTRKSPAARNGRSSMAVDALSTAFAA